MEMLMNLELSLLNPATFTVATLTTVMTLYVYFMQPSMLIKAYFRFAVRLSGMRMNYTKPLPDGFRFFYGEKGFKQKGQMSILMLHGFSADHFMWAPIVRNIPSYMHVIVVDLPGHGLTSDPVNENDIELRGQVKRIKQFLELIDMGTHPLHLVGVSMGAVIAGIFTAEFPQLVSTITLICPWMKTPSDSRIIKENKKIILEQHGGLLTLENCPMLPQTADELQNMLDISHYHSVKYPQQILKGAVELRKQKNDIYLHLVNILISEETSMTLENQLNKIRCPSQVIWGRDDWVVDVSGVDVLKEKMVDCQQVNILNEYHAVIATFELLKFFVYICKLKFS
ncbi:Alpha beta hydrolase [Bulinus truncatus]|nr:Alpha beta hydrolase [Bulinus truncatus]